MVLSISMSQPECITLHIDALSLFRTREVTESFCRGSNVNVFSFITSVSRVSTPVSGLVAYTCKLHDVLMVK